MGRKKTKAFAYRIYSHFTQQCTKLNKISVLVVKMSKVLIILILTITKLSVGEILNDSSSDEIQKTACFLNFQPGGLEVDETRLFQFVIHGIFLPIVALFGFVCNIISIFIFTRRELRTPINLIFTGKKHFD